MTDHTWEYLTAERRSVDLGSDPDRHEVWRCVRCGTVAHVEDVSTQWCSDPGMVYGPGSAPSGDPPDRDFFEDPSDNDCDVVFVCSVMES